MDGFEVPSWDALVPPHEVDNYEPGEARHGWQHEAAWRVERLFRSHLLERLAEHEQALLRSQSGPMAGMALSASPSNFLFHIEPHFFMGGPAAPSPSSSPPLCACLSLWLSSHSLGHHRAACARGGDGDLQSRVLPLDCATKEAPEWRRTSCFATWIFQCLLHEEGGDWRSSLTVSHCSLWTPHWFPPLCCDGSARPGAAHTEGAVLALARRRKERTFPELIGRNARARLVVLAGEIGGRWSSETNTFWPRPKLERSLPFCDIVWSKRGVCGGDLSWRVLQQGLLQCPFWIFAPVGWMVMCRRPTRW